MAYKITKENLRKAVNEAVNKKKNIYKNLFFVDSILKEYPDFKKTAKNIIKEKRDNGKSLYNYLLNECGCASKYNKIAEYVDYKNEDELLYDEPVTEYYDDPFQDYDLETDDSERWDKFDKLEDIPQINWNDEDEGLDQYFDNDGIPVDDIDSINEMPKYWVAEKEGKKRFTECSSLNEDIVKGEIQNMEKDGYKITAFKNEADMKKYLSN